MFHSKHKVTPTDWTVKKTLKWLMISILLIAMMAIGAPFAALHTAKAPQVVKQLLESLTPYQIEIGSLHYTAPYQFEMEQVSLHLAAGKPDSLSSDADYNHPTLQLPKLTLWLSQWPWKEGKLAFDSVLIEEARLDVTQLRDWLNPLGDAARSPLPIHTQQLALKHVDLSGAHWSARDVDLQIQAPSWQSDTQTVPFGDIQLAAKQLYIHGEALNNLLIDGRYRAQNSTVYGASFDWNNAQLSGQAEQYPHGWSLVNVTLTHQNQNQPLNIERLRRSLTAVTLPIVHINSLDILGATLRYQDWQLDNLDASLENLDLTQSLWQQDNGYLSLSADRIHNGELALLSPLTKITFNQGELNVQEWDADFKQGRVQLRGKVSPTHVALDEVKLNNIKWLEDTQSLLNWFERSHSTLDTLSIEQLHINNGQVIQVEKAPYWQLSGLNVRGKGLTLIQDHQLGLYSGELEMSANNASYDKLLTTQAVLNARVEQGIVYLDRFFAPLATGYIDASGHLDRRTISRPWSLTLHGDGVPLEQSWLLRWLPFTLSGFAELSAELSGLAGDYSMLAHSVSGQVTLAMHQATLEAHSSDGEQQYQLALPSEPLVSHVDRGRIELSAPFDSPSVAGHIDLTKPRFATLLIKSESGCQHLWSEVFSQTTQIFDRCP